MGFKKFNIRTYKNRKIQLNLSELIQIMKGNMALFYSNTL